MSTPYDMGAPVYRVLIDPFLSAVRRETLRELQLRFPDPDRVRILEVGCGTGAQARSMARAGFRVTALDPSKGMIRETGSRLKGRLERNRKGHAVRGNGVFLPFQTGVFDAVVMQMALHEMPAATRLTVGGEMKRVSHAEGLFFFVDFLERSPWSVARVLLTLVERLAGRDHYENGRGFIGEGGIVAFARGLGLHARMVKSFYNGQIGLVVAGEQGKTG